MILNQEGWIAKYEQRKALWLHDGNSARPHALLRSGQHSSGFFNSEPVMEDPCDLDVAAHELVGFIRKADPDEILRINRVVGPAMGGITLAHDIARNISFWGNHVCLRAYAEKVPHDPEVMAFTRTSPSPGEKVLIVEDVLTTGGSVERTALAVTKAGGIVQPYICVLVNRTGKEEINGRRIISLINREMPTWPAEECPLCRAGSEAIKPKAAANWELLNAQYPAPTT